MEKHEFTRAVRALFKRYEKIISTWNIPYEDSNGIYRRFVNPVLTREHIPPFWIYDLDYKNNPDLLLRLGVNSTFNAGALMLDGKYYMVVRVEGFDVKSFFAIAESKNGIDGWRFHDHPLIMPEATDPETNVYDIRLTRHEDGWIYGLFCAERKDKSNPDDSSAAIASCGIARTRDLKLWERLPDLVSGANQQRNCVLHPEFIDGKYMLYTRPQSGFIETGQSGISIAFTESMEGAEIFKERLMDAREYHTVKEVKNGQGPPPIKTEHGWLHLAHGVRRTAAGLRYTLYLLLSDLNEPWKVIRRPSGHFLEPLNDERVGDVSNVVFSNGWIVDKSGRVLIYYGSSDTRIHVAESSIKKLTDYALNTPEDNGRTHLSVKQRDEMISKNIEIIKREFRDLI